jgi:hypothetical protein
MTTVIKKILMITACVTLILGVTVAASAAETPSESDWPPTPEYRTIFGDESATANIGIVGWILPRKAGGGTIPPPPDEDEPGTPGTNPPNDEDTPDTPGTIPPNDGVTPPNGGGTSTPGGGGLNPDGDSDGAAARTDTEASTQYPDSWTSSTPGAITVPVPGSGGRSGDGKGNPDSDIDGSAVPESSGPGGIPLPLRGDSWSMMNALFAIISLVAAFVCIVFFVTRRQEDRETYRKRLFFLAVSIVAAAAGIALFILTQDLAKSTQLFDKWSAVFGALAAVSIVAVRFAYAKQPETRKA